MLKKRILLSAAALAFVAGLGLVKPGAAMAQSVKPIIVATDSTFPPFESMKDGKQIGFDIDLMDAVGKIIGRPVQWTSIDFKGLVPGVLAGRFDMAVSAIYITPARENVVNFTNPYYDGGLSIIKRKDEPQITDVNSLFGKKVSVQQGTKSVSFLATHYPKISAVSVETNEEMFDMLRTDRVDAVVTGLPAARLFVSKNPDMVVLPQLLTKEEYGMVVSKQEPKLLKEVNDALNVLKQNGEYEKIVHKWFGSQG